MLMHYALQNALTAMCRGTVVWPVGLGVSGADVMLMMAHADVNRAG